MSRVLKDMPPKVHDAFSLSSRLYGRDTSRVQAVSWETSAALRSSPFLRQRAPPVGHGLAVKLCSPDPWSARFWEECGTACRACEWLSKCVAGRGARWTGCSRSRTPYPGGHFGRETQRGVPLWSSPWAGAGEPILEGERDIDTGREKAWGWEAVISVISRAALASFWQCMSPLITSPHQTQGLIWGCVLCRSFMYLLTVLLFSGKHLIFVNIPILQFG